MSVDAFENGQGPISNQEQDFANGRQVLSDGRTIVDAKGRVILSEVEFMSFQEKIFSIISENNGKLIFGDLLQMVGGNPYKQHLYKALMNLARLKRIVRIRGIGKKRIEFFYYDTKKTRRTPPSAAVSYVSP